MRHGIKVLPVLYLVNCAFCAGITLEFYDHGRTVFFVWDEHYIRKAFACCHFLYDGVFVKSIEIGDVYRALQGVLVVVASIACDMYVRDVQSPLYGLCISGKGALRSCLEAFMISSVTL